MCFQLLYHVSRDGNCTREFSYPIGVGMGMAKLTRGYMRIEYQQRCEYGLGIKFCPHYPTGT